MLNFLRYLGNPDADDKYVGWNWLRSDDDESQVRKENIIRKLKLFKEAFDKIEETNFNFMPIMIKEESATVDFTYEVTVYPQGSSKQDAPAAETEPVTFKVPASLQPKTSVADTE